MSHFVDLDQGDQVICEADHILDDFHSGDFAGDFVRNELTALELLKTNLRGISRMERVMSQAIPSWRTDKAQTLWLSRLIETMEKFSRPDWRARPVDRLDRLAMVARLGQPAMACAIDASRFNLRN